jgi:hypothetical protein
VTANTPRASVARVMPESAIKDTDEDVALQRDDWRFQRPNGEPSSPPRGKSRV